MLCTLHTAETGRDNFNHFMQRLVARVALAAVSDGKTNMRREV